MATRLRSTRPETRYAYSDGVSIAYQMLGEGSVDIVMVPGFASHLEHAWQLPKLAHFYNRLASFSRLTIVDKRGVGLSDRVPPSDLPGIEQRKDDLMAVLEAADIDHASIVAISDGGPLAMLYAATYPERVDSLVVINTYARRVKSADHEQGLPAEMYRAFMEEAQEHWGEPVFAEALAPGSADDPEFRDWWGTALRVSMSPGAAQAMLEMNAAIDIRAALPAIRVPTLVIHRSGDQVAPVAGGRYLAEHIVGARLLELPGDDHFPWLGDAETILGAIEEFVTGDRSAPSQNLQLASLLFTDIVSSTETAARLGLRDWTALLKTHDGIIENAVSRFGGTRVKDTGDGSLNVFQGPARAVHCWNSIRSQLSDLGIEIRGGLHTSEVEMVDGDVRGLGVHIAARLMSLAAPGELIVSSVVRDLSAGSGLDFVDRGSHELKGVPGDWQVYSVKA